MAKKEMAKNDNEPKEHADFPLGRENYKLLAIGFVIIIIGFILMAGGGSEDPNQFNPEIFSFRRITLAPLVLLFGFVSETGAIMKKTR